MDKAFDAQVSIPSLLSTWDLLVIIFFLAVSLVVGKIAGAKKISQGDDEYLLMAKNLSLPLFVATLVSTWYGGIFGVTQIAFENGIYGFFTQGLFWYLAYFIFAIFLARRIRKSDVKSLPEFLGQKFGPRARKFSGAILFLHALPITYALSLGLVISMICNWNLTLCMALGVSFVALYSSFGGFRSVVLTDFLQFILMFAAVILVLAYSMYFFGGWLFLTSELPEKYFSWRGDKNASHALVWLFSACTTTFVHPAFYQRCLAAKSDRVAVRGILIAIFFWFLFDVCTSLGGMYAKALLPEAHSRTAYFLYGLELLPVGLKGFFVAGVMATILSTMDSFLFSAATTISYDVFSHSDAKKSRHVWSIFVTGAVVIMIAFLMDYNFERIWLFCEGFFSVSVVIPAIFAILTKTRFSEGDFIWPAISAFSIFVIANIIKSEAIFGIPPFYLGHLTSALVLGMRLAKKALGDTAKSSRADELLGQ